MIILWNNLVLSMLVLIDLVIGLSLLKDLLWLVIMKFLILIGITKKLIISDTLHNGFTSVKLLFLGYSINKVVGSEGSTNASVYP